MSRRPKYMDRHSAGSSDICPFIPGEHPKNRHDRRLDTNLRSEANVRDWAEDHGITLRVLNDGHHWHFAAGKKVVEWWPSSAKLVRDKKWRNGVHVHDFKQAMAIVADHFGVTENRT